MNAGNNKTNKSQLIEAITKKLSNCSEEDVALGVNKILDYLTTCLSQQKRVEIRGFGSFCTRYRRGKLARNPRTGEKVVVEEKYVPFFKAGKKLRDRINQPR